MTRLLSDAQDAVQSALISGKLVKCECCTQDVKMYSRHLFKTMWKCLLYLDAHSPGVVGKDIEKNVSRDYPKLAYWGLVEQDKEDRTWSITSKGRDFVQGKIDIPKYAHVYNKKVRGYSKAVVTADDLKKRFSKAEIMDPKNLKV